MPKRMFIFSLEEITNILKERIADDENVEFEDLIVEFEIGFDATSDPGVPEACLKSAKVTFET